MATNATAAADLTVRGEPVERVYGNFVDRRFVVNRRYQRKLIWTVEEKHEFIDSLIKGFPVPIILLAESANRESNELEIIDGMQRMDAIVSYIENKFPYQGKYFDLEAMAVAKANLDEGIVIQKEPKLDRASCVRIASYLVPLSIYEFADDAAVDTVFRRINSGGRQLSRQELRSAGATGHFATVVRRLAAKIRGDDSLSDLLKLNEMQSISVTNKDLEYGIDVDQMFWVKEGILARDRVRKSQDEEIIADIVAYMVSDEAIASRTEFLDEYYQEYEEHAAKTRYHNIDSSIQKRSVELVIDDFIRIIDRIKLLLAKAGLRFDQLLFSDPQHNPVPRYFQVVFLALHDLIIKKSNAVSDIDGLLATLKGCGDHINVQGGGGRWGAEARGKAVESAVGMIQKHFAPSKQIDPAKVFWITQLQNLLVQSYTEQSSYDFKQGFFSLGNSPGFDEESFEKILKTLVGIANIGKNRIGYVIVGIAENAETAARIEQTFGAQPRPYERFWVSGVDHEIDAMGKNQDNFFQYIVDKIKGSPISEPLKGHLLSHLKPVRYYEKTVYVFETKGMDEPSRYGDDFYIRVGSQLNKVDANDLGQLFIRYLAS